MLVEFIVLVALLSFNIDDDNGTPSDGMDRQFECQVADGLEHLWDYCYLAKHPLAKLKSVERRLIQQPSSLHVYTGQMVSEVLRAAIETLKPTNGHADLSREKHYHTILTRAYVEGISNKNIARSIDVGERTLYRYSIKAIQAIAQTLRDWEA